VLVSLDEALGLGSRGRATGELLVESNNPLHARGIGGTANGLEPILSALHDPLFAHISSIILCHQSKGVSNAQSVVLVIDRKRTGGGSGARTLGEATCIHG